MKAMKKAIEVELREHPWATEEIAQKLVEDHLRDDPNYYGEELEGDDELPEDEEAMKDDPFPEDEEEEEEEPMHKHGHPKPSLTIVFGAKPKKDPFPED